ncbi:GNAT family N-acetyltransferase [Parapedobacter deserti]|uniref:GNAT family N-acetyltransferase n=1 Tax=Parapedobacter deserti TaxID=1912957 RepID=A0ABV7JRB3_9SPHI
MQTLQSAHPHQCGKVMLEKFTAQDFAYYYTLVGNEQIMAQITERAIPYEEARADFGKLLINNTLHERFGQFKLLERSSGTFLGLGKLEITKQAAASAELGYILLPQYWGKGLGTEAARQLIEVARSEPQLKKLTAIIDPANLASRKILINQGFISTKLFDYDGLPAESLELTL